MELVVRLHLRLADKPYRITFVLDSVCWTEAPEDLRTLKNQRIRWQRRLCESLTKNVDLIFHAKGGTIGWVAFPFMAVFEWIGPAIEILGNCFLALSFVMGFVSIQASLILLVAAIGLGVLRDVWKLMLAAILGEFRIPSAEFRVEFDRLVSLGVREKSQVGSHDENRILAGTIRMRILPPEL